MEFIDHTGHIFSLSEYSSYPVGYEYSEHPYIFWISDEYNSQLSISCFYIKPIYILTSEDIDKISIKIENSKHFQLISPKTLREKLSGIQNDSVDWKEINLELDFYTEEAKQKSPDYIGDFVNEINNDNINLEKDILKYIYSKYFYEFNLNKHNLDDISETYEKDNNLYIKLDVEGNILSKDVEDFYIESLVSSNDIPYKIIPFYVLGNVEEEGCWLTNILIQINDSYCPITVGGTFIDEQESLIINGKNMGIDLPKDICRALYNSSFWNESPNMSLWNQKIKEYLLNYMKLKGERGNFQSAIQALKWFGYGDKLKLSSLIQNDNKIVNQYISDNFDLEFDIINEFRFFRCSTLMSISLPGIIENKNETNEFDFNADFWGEGKPKLIDMFKENADPKHYDEGDIDFIRPYYDWTFNEIGLKLCALKYYYKKYFLPIHLSIERASITNQVFANDIKMLSLARTFINEEPIYIHNYDIDIKFPNSNTIFYEDVTNKTIIVDIESWICDNNISREEYENSDKQYYEISDNCFYVDIDFINKNFENNPNCYFDCVLFVYQNNKILVSSKFNIYSEIESYNIKFIIYPAYWNKNFDMNFWISKNYKIELFVNNNWYEYKFNIKVPELDIELGKLEYRYQSDLFKQFSSVKEKNGVPIFNSAMYLPDSIKINNINFINDLIKYSEEENFVLKNNIKSDLPYYYYINENGNKEWLASGNSTIEERKDGIYIIPNKNSLENVNDKIDIIELGPYNKIYSSMPKTIDNFLDLYSTNINIPENKYLMNKVYIFNLYKRVEDKYETIKYIKTKYSSNYWKYENYEFGDNDSENVAELYSYIFDKNGNWNSTILEYYENNSWHEDDILKDNFDIYLMHDLQMWYIIFISKETIGNSKNSLIISDKKTWRIGRTINKYLFMEKNRSDKKFLINRMNFCRMTNNDNEFIYHFNSKDMIVARLINLKNISSKLNIGSRWSFIPMTFGNVYNRYFNSKTNIGLMSCAIDEFKLNKGYYQVKATYSVDNFVNEYEPRITKFLIDDDIESISYPEEPKIDIVYPSFDNFESEKLNPTIRYYYVKNLDYEYKTEIPSFYNEMTAFGISISENINNILIYITVNEHEDGSNKPFKIKYNTGKIQEEKEYCNFDENGKPEFSFTIYDSSWQNKFNKDILHEASPIYGDIFTIKFNLVENINFYSTDELSIRLTSETNANDYTTPHLDLLSRLYRHVSGTYNINEESVSMKSSMQLSSLSNNDKHIYIETNGAMYLSICNANTNRNDEENIPFLVSYSFTDKIEDTYTVNYKTFTNYDERTTSGKSINRSSFIIEIANIPKTNNERVISICCYTKSEKIQLYESQYIIHILS